MGQRLVISCIKNQECFAKIYYHWSAYTYDAFWEARHILKFIKPDMIDDIDTALVNILVALYANVDQYHSEQENIYTGGLYDICCRDKTGRREEQLNYIKEHYPKAYAKLEEMYDVENEHAKWQTCMVDMIYNSKISRNCGVMCVMPDHFEEYDREAEGELEINFDDRKVYNYCIFRYSKEDAINLFREVYGRSNPEEIYETLDPWVMPCDFNLMAVPFEKIKYALSIFSAHELGGISGFRYHWRDDKTGDVIESIS